MKKEKAINVLSLKDYRERKKKEQEAEKSALAAAVFAEIITILAPVPIESINYVVGGILADVEIIATAYARPGAVERKRQEFPEAFAENTRLTHELRKKYHVDRQVKLYLKQGFRGIPEIKEKQGDLQGKCGSDGTFTGKIKIPGMAAQFSEPATGDPEQCDPDDDRRNRCR